MSEPEEDYGIEAERQRLRRQWAENERSIERLSELPTGEVDPAATERRLDSEQDAIRFELGRQSMDWAKEERDEE